MILKFILLLLGTHTIGGPFFMVFLPYLLITSWFSIATQFYCTEYVKKWVFLNSEGAEIECKQIKRGPYFLSSGLFQPLFKVTCPKTGKTIWFLFGSWLWGLFTNNVKIAIYSGDSLISSNSYSYKTDAPDEIDL